MELERGLRIARKIITRPETEREAIKRTLSDEDSKQAFNGVMESGFVGPDDFPNAHFKIRRRMNLPFRRKRSVTDFNISSIVDNNDNPQKNI